LTSILTATAIDSFLNAGEKTAPESYWRSLFIRTKPKMPDSGLEDYEVIVEEIEWNGSMIFRLMQVRQLQVCLIKFANHASLPNQVR